MERLGKKPAEINTFRCTQTVKLFKQCWMSRDFNRHVSGVLQWPASFLTKAPWTPLTATSQIPTESRRPAPDPAAEHKLGTSHQASAYSRLKELMRKLTGICFKVRLRKKKKKPLEKYGNASHLPATLDMETAGGKWDLYHWKKEEKSFFFSPACTPLSELR